jgi:hypothetical protein
LGQSRKIPRRERRAKMAPPDRRAAIKASLQNKTRESYERRDDSGQFKSIFKDEFSNKGWKCGEGDHLIDIIPYPAGKHDPKSKEGEWGYLLDIWVHYAVGVNQDAYVCPARNFSLPCPICEYREEVRRTEDYDEDLVKELTPKRRSIYNVVCYDSEKEEGKGIQIFDCAHWFMEKHISSLAKTPVRGAGKSTDSYIAFSDPDEGKSIAFTRKGSRRNTEFLGHKFVDRNYAIPDELLNSAFILDECVNIYGYQEIKDAFLGGTGSDVSPEDVPAPSPPPVPERHLRQRETPAPSAASPPAPATRVRTATSTANLPPVCPVEGGTFGVDCEKYAECNGCAIWDPCSEEADKLAAGGGEAPAPPAPRPAAPSTPRPGPRPVPAPAAARPTTAGAPPTGPRRGLTPRGR